MCFSFTFSYGWMCWTFTNEGLNNSVALVALFTFDW